MSPDPETIDAAEDLLELAETENEDDERLVFHTDENGKLVRGTAPASGSAMSFWDFPFPPCVRVTCPDPEFIGVAGLYPSIEQDPDSRKLVVNWFEPHERRFTVVGWPQDSNEEFTFDTYPGVRVTLRPMTAQIWNAEVVPLDPSNYRRFETDEELVAWMKATWA